MEKNVYEAPQTDTFVLSMEQRILDLSNYAPRNVVVEDADYIDGEW